MIDDQITPVQEKNTNNGFKKELFIFVWETAKVIVISLAIILPIRYYLVQPFFVKGASMESNFEDGDYLLVDEISYRFSEPQRGNVIVFRYPKDPSQFFIKRIIGLPRERVVINNDAVTIYNPDNSKGFVLKEAYLDNNQSTLGNIDFTLSSGEYYVLGDNRLHSSDSRIWGPVPRANIIGKASIRAWPVSKAEVVPAVSY